MANNLTITVGNTLVINYTNQTNANPPAPISLTGATVYITVKSVPYDTSANDSTAIFQLTTANGGIVLNSSNSSQFTATATAVQTELLTPGLPYYWDITIKYANGQVITPVTGQITVKPTTTNSAS